MDTGHRFSTLRESKLDDHFDIELPTEADRRRQESSCTARLRQYGRTRTLGMAAVLVVVTLAVIFLLAAAFTNRSSTYTRHNGRPYYKAIIIGDWGRHGTLNQSRVAQQMANVAAQQHIDVIISVGDNFYTWGVHNLSDPQFNSTWRHVYDQPELATIPWQVVLGNHDWRGDSNAQVQYTTVAPRWNMPSKYFTFGSSFEGGCVSFVMTDTSPYAYNVSDPAVLRKMPTLPTAANDEQVQWLGSTLADVSAKCGWTIAIGHHPFYSAGEHGDNLGVRDLFLPLFTQYKVATYVAGHDHDMQHIVVDDFNYFVSGAGSDIRQELDWQKPGLVWASVDPGFMLLTLTPDVATYDMYNADGTLMYTLNQTVPV